MKRICIVICFVALTELSRSRPLIATEQGRAEATTEPIEYKLPDSWKGTNEGNTVGNPYLLDGVALWRADHIWPDDWLNAKNYHPLKWVKKQWALPRKADGEQQDRPQLGIDAGEANLSGFASRWGTQPGTRSFSNKIPALVFIAPKEGSYILSATVENRMWTGDGAVTFLILKHRDGDDAIKKLSECEIADLETIKVDKLQISLARGDELIFVPVITKTRSGCDVNIREFSLTRTQSAELPMK